MADPKSSSSRRCRGRLRWELKSEDSRVPLHSLDRTPTDYQMRIRPAILGTNACRVRPPDLLLSSLQSVQQEFELEIRAKFSTIMLAWNFERRFSLTLKGDLNWTLFIDRVNCCIVSLSRFFSNEKLKTILPECMDLLNRVKNIVALNEKESEERNSKSS